MYILTVLLHKKWDGHKSQTDEMSRHRHYRGELSFRRKKDLRCTAHTTISFKFSSYVYVQKKKKRGVTIYNRGEQTSSRDYKKWLGDCSQYSHAHTRTHALTSRWVKTRLHWPWFHKHKPFSTGLNCTKELQNVERPHTLKIVPPRRKQWSALVQSHHTAIPISYCTTGQSDPLNATMVT